MIVTIPVGARVVLTFEASRFDVAIDIKDDITAVDVHGITFGIGAVGDDNIIIDIEGGGERSDGSTVPFQGVRGIVSG